MLGNVERRPGAPGAGEQAIAEGPHRQPRRDRGARDPGLQGRRHRQCRGVRRPRPGRALRPARRRGALAGRRHPGRLLPRHREDHRRRREDPAPTPCTPATASSPRTPSSPRPCSTPAWSGSARRRRRSRTSATRSRPATSPRRSAPRWSPGTKDPLEDADEVGRVRRGARPADRDQGGVRRRRPRPQGRPQDGGGRRRVRVRRPRGGHRVRSRRVLRREVPRQAAARRDPVPGRPARQRRGGLHPRLLAPAPPPEAGRGGARAVPHRRPGRAALRVVQGDPARGRVRRRRHLRVPRRPGRHDLLPRGQHPAPGRAPRLRGGHRHRPGARDVPDRRRRGARVRRPGGPRPLDRVPDQRRGRRPQLHARPRHPVRVAARRRAPASGSTAATTRARPSRARSTRWSPS